MDIKTTKKSTKIKVPPKPNKTKLMNSVIITCLDNQLLDWGWD